MDWNYLLEDLHRNGAERTESALLAHLLRDHRFREAFLEDLGLDWPCGRSAEVRCEVKIDGGSSSADIVMRWTARGLRHALYIENKPWAKFTSHQPANYIRHIRHTTQTEERAGFVLLWGVKGVKTLAERRLRQSRAVTTWATGGKWRKLDKGLQIATPGRTLRFRSLKKVYAALSVVAPRDDLGKLATFLAGRHERAQKVSKSSRNTIDALLSQICDDGVEGDLYEAGYGQYLWTAGHGRHERNFWLGIYPRTAAQLEVPSETPLLVQSGVLTADEQALRDVLSAALGVVWREVDAGDWLPEWGVALNGAEMVEQVRTLLSLLSGVAN